MANYTIEQCLGIAAIPQAQKEWLQSLLNSRLPRVSTQTFTARNQAELVTVVNGKFETSAAAKARRVQKSAQRQQCHQVLNEIIGGKGTPQLISPAEFLPKLQELKAQAEQKTKASKIAKAFEASGMTKEELIAFAQNL